DRPAKMLLRLFGFGESTGGFNDHLRPYRFPLNGCRVLFGKHLDRSVVNGDGIAGNLDVVLEVAENGVVLEQMGQGRGAGEIVDSDKFEVRIVNCRAQHIAPDPAETVDANFGCHECTSPGRIQDSEKVSYKKVSQRTTGTASKLIRLAESVRHAQMAGRGCGDST